MKKMIGLICVLAGIAVAQTDYEQIAYSRTNALAGTIGSTVATQYVGTAVTTARDFSALTATAARWKIKREKYDAAGNIIEYKYARPANGDLYGNVWDDRATLNYY